MTYCAEEGQSTSNNCDVLCPTFCTRQKVIMFGSLLPLTVLELLPTNWTRDSLCNKKIEIYIDNRIFLTMLILNRAEITLKPRNLTYILQILAVEVFQGNFSGSKAHFPAEKNKNKKQKAKHYMGKLIKCNQTKNRTKQAWLINLLANLRSQHWETNMSSTHSLSQSYTLQ